MWLIPLWKPQNKIIEFELFLYIFLFDSTKPYFNVEFLDSPHIAICLHAASLTLTPYLLKPLDFLFCRYYQLLVECIL
jgi:hypothetical protein